MLKSKAMITVELPFQTKSVSTRVEGPTWKRSKVETKAEKPFGVHTLDISVLTHPPSLAAQKDERFWEQFRVTCKKPRGCETRGQPDSSNRVILLF